MFTGIVQSCAAVVAATPGPFGVRLSLDVGGWTPAGGRVPIPGDSICCNGVCLTLTSDPNPPGGRGEWVFDVIAETLSMTTLGALGVGDRVNLEPAVTASEPLGGHVMQGHVDGVGEVIAVEHTDQACRVRLRPPAGLMGYMIPKGSVALDGVSLTLAVVEGGEIEVALIPLTLAHTTLGAWKPGDRVNIEADILTKTVVATVERMASASDSTTSVTMDLLKRAGFVSPSGLGSGSDAG